MAEVGIRRGGHDDRRDGVRRCTHSGVQDFGTMGGTKAKNVGGQAGALIFKASDGTAKLRNLPFGERRLALAGN